MTRKEQLRMDNIIKENDMLKEKMSEHLRIYADTISENVCLKARLRETLNEVFSRPIAEKYKE